MLKRDYCKDSVRLLKKRRRMSLISILILSMLMGAFSTVTVWGASGSIVYDNQKGKKVSLPYDENTHKVLKGIYPDGDASWPSDGGAGWTGESLFGFIPLTRFGAWSTVQDAVTNPRASSADRADKIAYWKEAVKTFRRGGANIDKSEIEGRDLTLFEQYADIAFLGSNVQADFNKKKIGEGRPNIKTNNLDAEFESKDTAFPVDHAQVLRYKAYLDYYDIADSMWMLWARIDKVASWDGYVRARFDARTDFDKSVEIAFTSTWLKPDFSEEEKERYGIEDIQPVTVPLIDGATGKTIEGKTTTGWKYTFSTAKLKQTVETINVNGEDKKFYNLTMPVKLVPKSDFVNMSLEEFMRPMQISLMSDYARGINNIITEESYNAIASGDQPYVITKGDIALNINGGSFGNFQMNLEAADEYAKLYPTGLLTVDFKEYKDGKVQEDSSLRDSENLEGRAKRSDYPKADVNNYEETYDLLGTSNNNDDKKKYLSKSYTELDKEGYRFYGYRVNKGKELVIDSDLNGSYESTDNTRDSNIAGKIFKVGDKDYTDVYLKRAFGLKAWDSITLLYEKIPNEITIHYVDVKGNSIAEPKVLKGEAGDSYLEKPIKVEGYSFSHYDESKSTAPERGILKKFDDRQIVFVYTKNQVKTGDNPNTGDKPNTGDSNNVIIYYAILLSLTALLATVLMLYKKTMTSKSHR